MIGSFTQLPTDPQSKAIDQNTPLKPFWETNASFYSSVNASSTKKFGYTYPEIAAGGANPPPNYIQDLIFRLYGNGNFITVFNSPTDDEATRKAIDALNEGKAEAPNTALAVVGKAVRIPKSEALVTDPKNVKLVKPAPSNPGHDDYVVTPDTYRDWIVNITIEKYALGGSASIGFFLGNPDDIPANPAEWVLSPNFVGTFDIFANKISQTGCSNCKKQAEQKLRIGGTIHLTKPLIHRQIALVDDDPVDYLTKYLWWRCFDVEGRSVDPADIPSLKVSVHSAPYNIVPGLDPQRSEYEAHYPVTRGKPGGVGEEGDL